MYIPRFRDVHGLDERGREGENGELSRDVVIEWVLGQVCA
jgi:hypothetical protein